VTDTQAPSKDPSRTPPTKEEHPTTVWICENNRCRYYQVRRRVAWQHLGAGLYLVGQIRCLCGHLPIKAPRGA